MIMTSQLAITFAIRQRPSEPLLQKLHRAIATLQLGIVPSKLTK